jgi:hypothetical protein
MNILLAIAHYAQPTPSAAEPLLRCLIGWRGLAESGVQDFGGPCKATKAHQLDILVVDDGVHSAAEYITGDLADRISIAGDPLRLPLECRRLMDEARGGYDLLCYSEHDNWPLDPMFFDRVFAWQSGFPDQVLIPHRYERISVPPYKVYIDGDNGWGAYGAMWAVTAQQWAAWRVLGHFLEYTDQFAGPLESGCAWSLMQTFNCVKLQGLESEHVGDRYAQNSIRRGLAWS